MFKHFSAYSTDFSIHTNLCSSHKTFDNCCKNANSRLTKDVSDEFLFYI